MDKIAIFKRLKQHYNRVKEDGYNILFIALQGSQNYGLDNENSDVDSIAVVLPTLNEISLNQPPISRTIKLDNECIDIKDVRLISHQWIKQNTQYLQILFTEFKIVAKEYRDFYNQLIQMNEDIVTINRTHLYRNIIGIGTACYRDFYSKGLGKRYKGKNLYHLIRLTCLFDNLNNNLSYKDSLTTYPEDIKDLILQAKEASLKYTDAKKLNERYYQKLLNQPFDVDHSKCIYQPDIEIKLNSIIKQIIAFSLKQEMQIITKEVNLEQYPNVYFTSDCHFGHTNIIKYEHRDEAMNISGTMEHDQKLISNWNSIVKPKDLVIILGDFSFHKPDKTMEILRQLNGYKVLIEGNHDCIFLKNKSFDRSLFEEIAEYKEYHYRGYHLCLMHYPITSFKHIDKETNNYLHIHGHIHSAPYEITKKSYNVGVDINDYKPIHINTVIEKCLSNIGGMKNGQL